MLKSFRVHEEWTFLSVFERFQQGLKFSSIISDPWPIFHLNMTWPEAGCQGDLALADPSERMTRRLLS